MSFRRNSKFVTEFICWKTFDHHSYRKKQRRVFALAKTKPSCYNNSLTKCWHKHFWMLIENVRCALRRNTIFFQFVSVCRLVCALFIPVQAQFPGLGIVLSWVEQRIRQEVITLCPRVLRETFSLSSLILLISNIELNIPVKFCCVISL